MNRKVQTKFLSYCIGLTEDPPPINFRNLTEKDWSKLLTNAQQHSILPLLYHHLTQNKEIHVPTNILEKLKQAYLRNSLRNTQIYYELSNIINKANDDNIPIIVLKGADIAVSLYPSIALRPMKDFDLFIKIEDIQKVHDILIQLGWHGKQSLEAVDYILQTEYSLKYEKPKLQIDLHLKVPELSALNLWTNVKSMAMGSTKMLILKPEILLIFLCNHLYEHARDEVAELLKFYDIVLALKKYRESIDWDYLIQSVYTNQSENVVYHILEIINSEFGEDIPLNVFDKLKSTKYTIQIRKSLYKPLPNIAYKFHPTRKIVSAIYLHWVDPKSNTIGNIFKNIIESIFPSKEFMIERYSPKRSWLFFIYYPAYNANGIKNFFSILFKLMFKRK